MGQWGVNTNVSEGPISTLSRRAQVFVSPEFIFVGGAATPRSCHGPRGSRRTRAKGNASTGAEQVHAGGASLASGAGYGAATVVSTRVDSVIAAAHAQKCEMA